MHKDFEYMNKATDLEGKKKSKVENGLVQQLRRRPEVLDNERRERNASECYRNRDRI